MNDTLASWTPSQVATLMEPQEDGYLDGPQEGDYLHGYSRKVASLMEPQDRS